MHSSDYNKAIINAFDTLITSVEENSSVTVTSGSVALSGFNNKIILCNADGTNLVGTGVTSLPISNVNIDSIKTNTDEVYDCIDHVNNRLNVDQNTINGISVSVGSGNLNSGTQRVSIATDDVNSSAINNSTSVISGAMKTRLDSWNNSSKGFISMNIRNDNLANQLADNNDFTSPLAVDSGGAVFTNQYKLKNVDISVGSGINGSGVQRMTLATDDSSILQDLKSYDPIKLRSLMFPSAIPLTISSYEDNITTSYITIGPGMHTIGEDYTFLTSAQSTLYISSDATTDNLAGAGVRTVRIYYLDSTYIMRTKDASLHSTNGQTPEPITFSPTVIAINKIVCLTFGSSATNQGSLYIHNSSGANVTAGVPTAAAETYASVMAFWNISSFGHYTVPDGYVWMPTSFSTSNNRNGTSASGYMKISFRIKNIFNIYFVASTFFGPFTAGVSDVRIPETFTLGSKNTILIKVQADNTCSGSINLQGVLLLKSAYPLATGSWDIS